jgi:ubiquinone/menaquinone biosynthesis C-methylase UbiE
MLAGARHRFAKTPGIELRHADVAALPYTDGQFDSVNIANAVHCFPDVDGGLRDVLRVLNLVGRWRQTSCSIPGRSGRSTPSPARWTDGAFGKAFCSRLTNGMTSELV